MNDDLEQVGAALEEMNRDIPSPRVTIVSSNQGLTPSYADFYASYGANWGYGICEPSTQEKRKHIKACLKKLFAGFNSESLVVLKNGQNTTFYACRAHDVQPMFAVNEEEGWFAICPEKVMSSAGIVNTIVAALSPNYQMNRYSKRDWGYMFSSLRVHRGHNLRLDIQYEDDKLLEKWATGNDT